MLSDGMTGMADGRHEIHTAGLTATVLAKGAELCSLIRDDGRELIWQAGSVWPAHGPLLFPIVGALPNRTLTVDGRDHTMERHGFARRTAFDWVSRGRDRCTLSIIDTPATRAQYPYTFRLEAAYTIHTAGLEVALTAINTGDVPLPCSLGFHPAFNWPLDGGAKEDYRIELAVAEEDTVAELNEAGLIAGRRPSPLEGGRVLHLSDAVFAEDALVFNPLRSSSARFIGPTGRGIEVTWENAAQLGIWSKPGDFVCIEPWHGLASPVGFQGEFRDKPGLAQVPPGKQFTLRMTLRPVA